MKKILFLWIMLVFGSFIRSYSQEFSGTELLCKKASLEGVDWSKQYLFGFFFKDATKQNLQRLADHLTKDGYKVVRINQQAGGYQLAVEKVLVLDCQRLIGIETEFSQLAIKFQVLAYDGWDMGNAECCGPLITNEEFSEFAKSKSDIELFPWAMELYEFQMCSRAIEAFQLCIERKIETETAYYKKGVCLVEIGQMKEGLDSFKEVLLINPNHEKAAFNIGAVTSQIGDYSASIEYYRKAIQINPLNDASYYGVSVALYMLDKKAEAKPYCKKALEINPQNKNALELLKIL